MNVYILDQSKSFVGICDDYKSIIWTKRYFTPGDFELYLPATIKNLALLREDYYCVREQDICEVDDKKVFKNVMIIEKIQITTSLEDGNYLIVSGRCLKSLLARRIVWSQTNLSGNLEKNLRNVVAVNGGQNSSPYARVIPGLMLGDEKGFKETIVKQVTGANVSEFLAEVCKTYGIGWDIYIKGAFFYFELYKGVDRSYNQTDLPYVVFSPEFDNLLATDYQFDKTNYKNVALVGGEGEGTARKMVTVGTAENLDRYEIFVDSRNSSSNDGEISADEYTTMLEEEGNEALSESDNSINESISGEVEPSTNYTLGVDYFLGDIVEVINEYGIEAAPRIIEIIESEDDTGSYTIPTFSTEEG